MTAVTVLRLNHRKERDKRITIHVALVARAFGAKGMVYSGEQDDKLEESVAGVSEAWGGRFSCEHVKEPFRFARRFKGTRVHLTFYGMPLSEVVAKGAGKAGGKGVLVIVGGAKVPREFYNISEYNVSVTGQPHSEVAALAVFLHEFLGRSEERLNFPGWKMRINPSNGKKLVERKPRRKEHGRKDAGGRKK